MCVEVEIFVSARHLEILNCIEASSASKRSQVIQKLMKRGWKKRKILETNFNHIR